MSDDLEVLKLVCSSLEQAGMSYMLTGSVAANFYAVPRMTRDIDIVLELQEPNALRLFQLFQNDFYVSHSAITEAIKYQGMFNVIHNNTVVKVDFIIRKSSPYRAKEFERRRRVQLGNTPIWIVSPEDLIISKLYWAKDSMSEMQLRDVGNLLSALPELDREYLDEWVKNLGLENVFSRVQVHA